MANRYWEHNTTRRHVYIDDTTGRIIGNLLQRLSDKSYEAFAYGRRIGEYLNDIHARVAVELACVEVEAAEAAAKLAAAQKQSSLSEVV